MRSSLPKWLQWIAGLHLPRAPKKLKNIVEKRSTRPGRIFDITVQSMIVLSILVFSVETLPNLEGRVKTVLDQLEMLIVLVFTAEYLLRIYVANNKLRYILSFYGIVDLLAILPFYIIPGTDLTTIRIFRMLRLFSLMKLLRYTKAMSRLAKAIKIAREEMVLFGVVVCMLLYLSAVGIYYFENPAQPEEFKSIFHSLWWAVATLSTVGYGDIYPITTGGKIFTFFVLMTSMCIVAVPAGLLAAALSKIRLDEHEEMQRLETELQAQHKTLEKIVELQKPKSGSRNRRP